MKHFVQIIIPMDPTIEEAALDRSRSDHQRIWMLFKTCDRPSSPPTKLFTYIYALIPIITNPIIIKLKKLDSVQFGLRL